MKNTLGHTGSTMQLLQIYVVTHSYRMSSILVNILRRLGFFLLMLKYFRPEKRSTWLWQCFLSISCLNDTRGFKQTYCVIGQVSCSVRICQVCLIFIVQSLQCGRVADLTGLVVFSSIHQVSFFHAQYLLWLISSLCIKQKGWEAVTVFSSVVFVRSCF